MIDPEVSRCHWCDPDPDEFGPHVADRCPAGGALCPDCGAVMIHATEDMATLRAEVERLRSTLDQILAAVAAYQDQHRRRLWWLPALQRLMGRP